MFSIILVMGWLASITLIVVLWSQKDQIAAAGRRYNLGQLPERNRLAPHLEPSGIAFYGSSVIINPNGPFYESGRYVNITWHEVKLEANGISKLMQDSWEYEIWGIKQWGYDKYHNYAILLSVEVRKLGGES